LVEEELTRVALVLAEFLLAIAAEQTARLAESLLGVLPI
jgi:hypothetical protein